MPVRKNPIRDPRYVLELISRNSRARFMCVTHLTTNNFERSRFSSFPRLNNGTFPGSHCQPDRFSHIACRHQSFCLYCQETLPHKLSKPNEYNVHTSFILEKGKNIKNNPINNNCLHHVMIRTAKGARRTYFRNNNENCNKQSVWQTMLLSARRRRL